MGQWSRHHVPSPTVRARAEGPSGYGFSREISRSIAQNRDLPDPPFATTETYDSLDELRDRFTVAIRDADLVVVGSYVPEGRRVLDFVLRTARGKTAFYDIDTPVTLAALATNTSEYIECKQIRALDLYLSFTGGPTLQTLEGHHGAKRARPLLCSADPALYYPDPTPAKWDCGYLGTFSEDRQPKVDDLLLEPARQTPGMRFVVAGPQYPPTIHWPANVERIEHLPPPTTGRFTTHSVLR